MRQGIWEEEEKKKTGNDEEDLKKRTVNLRTGQDEPFSRRRFYVEFDTKSSVMNMTKK